MDKVDWNAVSGFMEASAGTGKTFRIMELLQSLMDENVSSGQDDNILLETVVLTFTEKAAGELKARCKERIRSRLKDTNNKGYLKFLRDIDQVVITTIHGFCNSLLLDYPMETGNLGSPKLVNVQKLIQKCLYECKRNRFGIQNQDTFVNILELIEFRNPKFSTTLEWHASKILSKTKSYDLTFDYASLEEVYEIKKDNPREARYLLLQGIVLQLVQSVEKELHSSNSITFDFMIQKVADAIQRQPKFKETLQSRFKICLLDEFQDTDKLQFEIFETIFFDHPDPKSKFFCIGDPKQSIYAFRGADIGVYMKAKQEFREKDFDKKNLNLETNYRSTKDMIEGYNLFFSETILMDTVIFPLHEVGFPKGEFAYTQVKTPEEKDLRYRIPNKDEKAIIAVEFEEKPNKIADVRDLWVRFICNEINRLVFSESPFVYEKQENGIWTSKQLRLQEIAVLCDNHKHCLAVQKMLSSVGIPSSIYKQTGIFQSEEALQLEAILNALIKPNDPNSFRTLLVSDLFQIDPRILSRFEEHSIESYEKTLIDKWVTLINQNKFAEFFRSLLEETRILWNQDDSLSWERKRTNYRQLANKLLFAQTTRNLSIQDLLEELRIWKTERENEREEEWFEKETEEDTVQILTLHASKGLEWPVVFIHHTAAIQNSHLSYEYPIEIEDGGTLKRSWILPLWSPMEAKAPTTKNAPKLEIDPLELALTNEAKRLFYVAMTRPNLRLYLFDGTWGSNFPRTGYGKILYPRIQVLKQNSEMHGISSFFEFRTVSKENVKRNPKEQTSLLFKQKEKSDQTWETFPFEEPRGKGRVLHSYSSWKRLHLATDLSANGKEKDEVQRSSDSDPAAEKKNQEVLPSNSKMGNLLHSILEHINFRIFENDDGVKHPSWKYSFEKAYQEYPYFWPDGNANFESLLFSLLQKAVLTSFPTPNGSLRLIDLPELDRKSELKFQMFLPHSFFGSATSLGPSQDSDWENFLKGAIDLVFVWKGMFYIADYKSDSLLVSDYNSSKLPEIIVDRGYDIQRDLYAFILLKYLSSLYGKKEALRKFGGVYYFFLRGMGAGSGVYYDIGQTNPWTEERFVQIEEEISKVAKEYMELEKQK